MIGVSPEKLEYNLERGEAQTQRVFVENLNPEPVQIMITVSDNHDSISIKPEQFTLPPSTLQDVRVEVSGRKDITAELSILARENVTGELQTQSGVRVPVMVDVAGVEIDAIGVIGVIGVISMLVWIKTRY